jgi:hypothetical protein
MIIRVFRARPKSGHMADELARLAKAWQATSRRGGHALLAKRSGGWMCVRPLVLSTGERRVQLKRLLAVVALAAAALALAATASAANHTTVTETDHIHGAFTEPEFDVNPCTAAAITSFDAYGNVVAQVTYFLEDGEPTEVWATFTETGKLTLIDANNLTYSGHFTAWGNFNLNERNTNNTVALTFRASGSDGSSLIVHETAHFAMNANGRVTVSFDRLSLDCG